MPMLLHRKQQRQSNTGYHYVLSGCERYQCRQCTSQRAIPCTVSVHNTKRHVTLSCSDQNMVQRAV